MISLKQMPQPDHEMGYTDAFLSTVFDQFQMKRFLLWMNGQTCAVDESVNPPQAIYYTSDVVRFLQGYSVID